MTGGIRADTFSSAQSGPNHGTVLGDHTPQMLAHVRMTPGGPTRTCAPAPTRCLWLEYRHLAHQVHVGTPVRIAGHATGEIDPDGLRVETRAIEIERDLVGVSRGAITMELALSHHHLPPPQVRLKWTNANSVSKHPTGMSIARFAPEPPRQRAGGGTHQEGKADDREHGRLRAR